MYCIDCGSEEALTESLHEKPEGVEFGRPHLPAYPQHRLRDFLIMSEAGISTQYQYRSFVILIERQERDIIVSWYWSESK